MTHFKILLSSDFRLYSQVFTGKFIFLVVLIYEAECDDLMHVLECLVIKSG
jgi:hypothetical protein